MSLLSSIGKMFSKLLSSIMKFLKKYWWIIVLVLIVVAVFFPAIIPMVVQYLSTAWTAVSGWVGSAFSTVGSWAGSAWTAAQAWVADASIGDVLKLAAGAAVLLNPEGIADAAGGLISRAIKAIPPVVWIAGAGLLAFWLWPDSDREQVVVLKNEGSTNV